MQALGRITVGGMSLFHGVKTPKVDDFFVVGNRSLPTPICIFHPRQTANAFNPMFICAFAICPILTVGSFAKIFKSVIRFVSVNVVNLYGWHIFCHIKPRQTMGRIRFSVNFNVNISVVFFQVTSLLTNLNFWSWRRPMKKTRCWIISEDRCKVRMFHASVLPDSETDCKIERGSQCLTN